MGTLSHYARDAAVEYAHRFAYRRNPKYFDYEYLGGDCTNFVSQCIMAGGGTMNYTPTFGWYYVDANRKAPAWTGVPYLWRFLTRDRDSIGPVGNPCRLEELLPGDLIQLSFDGQHYTHCPIVVSVGTPVTPGSVLVAAHSYDADNRPLDSYRYQKVRFLHIAGIYLP